MLNDSIWLNIRYLLITVGVSMLVYASKGKLSEDQALPIIEWAVGGFLTVGTWVWGNYVRKGTKAVPIETAKRTDVPTVSAATGQIEPATTGKVSERSGL